MLSLFMVIQQLMHDRFSDYCGIDALEMMQSSVRDDYYNMMYVSDDEVLDAINFTLEDI